MLNLLGRTYTFQLEGRHLAWEFLEKDEVLDLKDLSALEQGKSVDTSIRAYVILLYI